MFSYLLTTLLPLPFQWSFDANSDAVLLSIKVMTSTLIIQHFESYCRGEKDQLDLLIEKLTNGIISLSEFLFAQTRINIRKKNVVVNESSSLDGELDLNSLDISASLENQTNAAGRNENEKSAPRYSDNIKDYQLKYYHVQLLKNLIQYFSNEKYFLTNLKKVLQLGYNLSQRYPYEFNVHPRYSTAESLQNVTLQIGNIQIEYNFEYQGVSNFVSIPLEHERSLHRLACIVNTNYFSYLITQKVCFFVFSKVFAFFLCS